MLLVQVLLFNKDSRFDLFLPLDHLQCIVSHWDPLSTWSLPFLSSFSSSGFHASTLPSVLIFFTYFQHFSRSFLVRNKQMIVLLLLSSSFSLLLSSLRSSNLLPFSLLISIPSSRMNILFLLLLLPYSSHSIDSLLTRSKREDSTEWQEPVYFEDPNEIGTAEKIEILGEEVRYSILFRVLFKSSRFTITHMMQRNSVMNYGLVPSPLSSVFVDSIRITVFMSDIL